MQEAPLKPTKSKSQDAEDEFQSFSESGSSSKSGNKEEKVSPETILRSTSNDSHNQFLSKTLLAQVKCQNMQFPAMPDQIAKLFPTYQSNNQLIDKLKGKILELEELARKEEMLDYDEKNIDIEQCYDMEEISQFYSRSKQLYLERQSEIEKIKNAYTKINEEQLETIMLNDQKVKALVGRYIQKYRKIIDIQCASKQMWILTKQIHVAKNWKQSSQFRVRKLAYEKLMASLDDKKQLNFLSPQADEIATFTLKLPSQSSSPKETSKPLRLSIDEENNVLLVQFQRFCLYCPLKDFLSAKSNKSKELESKTLKLGQLISIFPCQNHSGKIVFVGSRNGLLFIGTSEGILRLFEFETKSGTYKLINMVGCFVNGHQIQEVTHYSFSNQPGVNEVLFVGDSKLLCRISLTTYRSEVIHRFSQKPLKNIRPLYLQNLQEELFLDFYKGESSGPSKVYLKQYSFPELESAGSNDIQEKATEVEQSEGLQKGLVDIVFAKELRVAIIYKGGGLLKALEVKK